MNRKLTGETLEVTGLVFAAMWHLIVFIALAGPVAMQGPTGTVEISEVTSI